MPVRDEIRHQQWTSLQIVVNTLTENKEVLKVENSQVWALCVMAGKGFSEWMLLKQSWQKSRDSGHVASCGEEEGTAGAKALRWKSAWPVPGTEWRPVRWGIPCRGGGTRGGRRSRRGRSAGRASWATSGNVESMPSLKQSHSGTGVGLDSCFRKVTVLLWGMAWRASWVD